MLFSYRAVNKDNKEISGHLEAMSRTNAITLLLDRGYTVLSLEAESGSVLDISLFPRVRQKDLIIFSRQISTLFAAEVSALRAFNLVSENIQNKYFRDILVDVAKSIEQGFSVEKSLLKHQHVFGDFFVSIVAVGEQSGTLPRSFKYLADHLERNADVQAKVRRALIYPIFVVVVFIAVMVLVLTLVVPQVSSILLQSDVELPLVTRVVIFLSDFFQQNISFILVSLMTLLGAFLFYVRTEDGKKSFDSFILQVPLAGRLLREYFLVRFTRNLGVMLASNVPIVDSLQTLSRSMMNVVYQEMVHGMSVQIQQGVKLSVVLAQNEYIGKNVAQIVRVGEETGSLQKALHTIADLYERQMENTVDLILEILQPAVIVVLGVAIGMLIGAVIIPIYSISSGI